VIGAGEPLLQVADGVIRERDDRGGTAAQSATERLRAGHVPDASRLESAEALQPRRCRIVEPCAT
jgi:hypothetical protein